MAKTGPKGKHKADKVDTAQLERLAEKMCTQEDMAYVLGCSVDTLTRNFAEIIKKGQAAARNSLRTSMFDVALKKNNTSVMIFLAKNHLGMKDNPELEKRVDEQNINIQDLKAQIRDLMKRNNIK